jgi:16S rRNA U1498 N3-methylase RsmE
MQLFITDDFKISTNKVSITEERIIKQLKKVLRARPGYTFFLQPKTTSNIQKRYFCKILEISDHIQAQIENIEEKKLNLQTKGVITSFLNKFDKMELIVQKLTEI